MKLRILRKDDDVPMRLKCRSTKVYTPRKVVLGVKDALGGINLDPATAKDNPTGAKRFYIHEDNGLKRPWEQGTFVNPPYGEQFDEWTRKIRIETTIVRNTLVALLPCGARFSTKYFQRDILRNPNLVAVTFIERRVRFLKCVVHDEDECPEDESCVRREFKNNPYDSALWCFNMDVERVRATLYPLGAVMKVEVQ